MANYIPLVLPAAPQPPTAQSAQQAYNQKVQNWLAECAGTVIASSESFLNSMVDLKAIEYSQVGDLPDFKSVVFLGNMSDSLVRPTRPSIDTSVVDLLAALNALTIPAAPNVAFNYTDPGYISSLRDPLHTKLLNDLLYGSYGIDTNDETALWARARDRASNDAQMNIDEVRRQAASTSFPMPQGAMYSAIEKARTDYLEKVNGFNRDITLKRADLYNETRKFTIEKVLASEDQSIGLYNAVQNRALDIARVTVDMAIKIYESTLTFIKMQQELIVKQIEAKLETAKAQVSVYASDVAAYNAFVQAVATSAHVAIANSRTVLERDKYNHQADVQIIQFRLEELKATIAKALDVNRYGADFYRTLLGASMSGIGGVSVATTAT